MTENMNTKRNERPETCECRWCVAAQLRYRMQMGGMVIAPCDEYGRTDREAKPSLTAEQWAEAFELLAELADEVDRLQGEVQRMQPHVIRACECPNDDDPTGCYCPDGFTHDDCPMGHEDALGVES